MRYENIMKYNELDLLGRRLETVRQVLATSKHSHWAQSHWTIVEQRLLRQYHNQLRELHNA